MSKHVLSVTEFDWSRPHISMHGTRTKLGKNPKDVEPQELLTSMDCLSNGTGRCQTDSDWFRLLWFCEDNIKEKIGKQSVTSWVTSINKLQSVQICSDSSRVKDGLILWRPWQQKPQQVSENWKTRGSWLHVDQNAAWQSSQSSFRNCDHLWLFFLLPVFLCLTL